MEKKNDTVSEKMLMAECLKVLSILKGIRRLIDRLEARIRAICPALPHDDDTADKPVVAKVVFHKDYSKSGVCLFLAHPEDADRILAWLHLQMDGKKLSPVMRMKPLCALLVNNAFSTPLSRKAFEAEFGAIDQSLFSRYFSRNKNTYDPSELEILYMAFLSFDFVNFDAPKEEV